MNVDNNEQVKFGRNLGHEVKTRIGAVMWTHQTKNIAAAFSVSMSCSALCGTLVWWQKLEIQYNDLHVQAGANSLH